MTDEQFQEIKALLTEIRDMVKVAVQTPLVISDPNLLEGFDETARESLILEVERLGR